MTKPSKSDTCCLAFLLFCAVFGRTGFCAGQGQAGSNRDKIASSLFRAAEAGDVETVKSLLAKYPDLKEARQDQGWTPLHAACFGGHLETVKFLVSEGADINALTDSLGTTLHWATHSYAGPQIKKALIEYLVELAPGLVNKPNDHGILPLMWAGNDLDETILLLLAKGADVNAKDHNGYSALHHWSRWWQNDRSEILIENGAKIDLRDNLGKTPLHLAAITGRLDKTELLLNHGAAVNARDRSGYTPLDYAKRFAHPGLADFIGQRGGLSNNPKDSVRYNGLVRQKLRSQEAAIWYLDSNGWAVKTRNHLLIFDYLNWGIVPPHPCLSNGRINPEEIQDLSTTVFVSNPSGFSQEIFEWRKVVENISFVFGYPPEGHSDVYVVNRGEKMLISGLEIFPVQAVGGGTGFIVKTDGLTIFHGGLHVLWKSDLKDDFLEGLECVAKNIERVDIAFVPISARRAVSESALEGFLSFGEIIKPQVLFPSGGSGSHKFLYPLAAEKIKGKRLKIESLCVDNRGDRFFYRRGRIMAK